MRKKMSKKARREECIADGLARRKKIDEWAKEHEIEGLMLFESPDYNSAIVGVGIQYTKIPLVIYDRVLCIEHLVLVDGMTEEEAEEFFGFNTEDAWLGEGTPMIITKPEDMF